MSHILHMSMSKRPGYVYASPVTIAKRFVAYSLMLAFSLGFWIVLFKLFV